MLEPVDHQYILIGQVARSHGVDGTILMIPEFYAPELFDDIELVRIENARGDLIPARIESVRVQEKNNRLSFFVKFDHISDRNEAEALKSFLIYINREKVAPLLEEEPAHDLTAFEVQNEQKIAVGVVDEVIDNPAHPIAVVQTGKQVLLIPLVDEYVTEIDEKSSIIYCQNLDQLKDL